MSNEVKRYVAHGGWPFEHCDGDWVTHADYAALEAECERLRGGLRMEVEAGDSWKRQCQDAEDERDALAAELAAIRAAGGEQVEAAFQLPAPCCEVADEKYNRCFFYRRTGDQTKRYHQPGTKLVALDEVEPVFAAMLAQHQRIVAAMAAELAEAREQIETYKSQFGELHIARNMLSRLSAAGFEVGDDMAGSIIALRAELEAARKQEHCAEIIEGWRIVFAGAGPILPIVERHGLKIGSKLYALPPLAGKVAVPDVLFDGFAVLNQLSDKAKQRTTAENVSDVLDAVVRLLRNTNQPEKL